jgi:single-strand DNA-binding protein
MSELRLPRVNVTILSGRLVRDPEIKYTQSGTPLANFTIAYDRSFQKNGEWVQETSYTDVVVWSKRAEQCGEGLHKGSPVLIEGYLQTRSWQDKNNNTRKTTEIVANKVSFLEKSEQSNGNSEQADDDQETPF